MADNYSGNLFIVAAPSGGGKTSLVKKLVDSLEGIAVSVSHTTRKKRPGEVDGVDYFFVNEPAFMHMVEESAFIEHAQVFNHFYGTSAEQITERLRAGIDIVLDIDWQGAEQIKHAFPNAVSIFVIPPSVDVLKKRLMDRRQDDDQVIASRMQSACDELSHYPEFDYLIVNDDFAKAADELKAIVVAHRLRMSRQVGQQRQLLSFLLSSQ
jgi:guanylate kinase